MKIETILFDLDGTLTDSGEGITKCVRLALDTLHIPFESMKALEVFIGPPLRDSFARFHVPGDQIERAIEIYRSRYTTVGLYENFPYPGIRELLERLRGRGYRLYVATSKPESMARDVLHKFGLDTCFDEICGATLDHSRDSKSSVIAYLLDKTGSRGNTVMVGDTIYDVEGAALHGIPTIGVSWGYGNISEMEAAGAAGIAHSMEELEQLLENFPG